MTSHDDDPKTLNKLNVDSNLSDGVTGGGVTDVVTLQHRQGPSVDGNVLGRGQEVEKEEHAALKKIRR